MKTRVAVVGGGVSGLTSAIALTERGYDVSLFADQVGQNTTSGAAGAIWFPYDAEPADKVIAWALETYNVLLHLERERASGVSIIELRQFSRTGEIQIPDWAQSLGAQPLDSPVATGLWPPGRRESPAGYTFSSGYRISVPLMDTTIYLHYLGVRLTNTGGSIHSGVRLEKLEDIDQSFAVVINCAGFGARELVHDRDLEPHRGQVVIVPPIPELACAVVCEEPQLIYAIPRTNDCVFGGSNEVSQNLCVDPQLTTRIVAECRRVLKISNPRILAERVGIRPFRKTGVRLELGRLNDGRIAVHNYGHGGAGFTLSWGCAQQVVSLLAAVNV